MTLSSLRRIPRAVALALLCALSVSPAAHGASYHLVLCGSGGEAEYTDMFRDWGTRLQDALVMRLGVPADKVALLTEAETDNAPPLTTTSNPPPSR